MRHLKGADYVCSTWSGGTTTQIAIAPEGALYAERDFLWRVSSAGVELEESDFTALPDYDRFIATLEGEMTLTHDGGEEIMLCPFAVHAFDGGVRTHSVGRCTDFNLMLRKGRCRGSLQALALAAGEVCEAAPKGEWVLYCAEGGAVLGEITLARGESACGTEPFSLRACEASVFMLAEIEKII